MAKIAPPPQRTASAPIQPTTSNSVPQDAPQPLIGSYSTVVDIASLQSYQSQQLAGGTYLSPESNASAYKKNDEQRTAASIQKSPEPSSYRPLQVGHASIDYETSSTVQVEMSSPLLRSLSPFMLRVEPPLAFGEDGGFLARKGNSIPVNLFTQAQRSGGYGAARKALSQSTLAVGVNGLVGSSQEFMRVNARSGTQVAAPPKPVGETNLGEPAIADLAQAVDLAWQLSAVMQVAPLVLLINPQNLSINYSKIQQFQDRSRHGYIFQAWGEEQPKLSITAKCGAFVSGGRGVQMVSRLDSVAWQNLMSAFHLYRNNGYIHDMTGKSNAHLFVGALSIHYDQWVYYGHMENFNWTLDEGNTHGGVEFSMEFTVSSMLDTASPSYNVAPMRSPTPAPWDAQYLSGATNSPGEFSIGFDSDGTPRLTTQGRVVTGESFGLLVPGGLEPMLQQGTGWVKPTAGANQGRPVSARGFQATGTVDLPGQRAVNVAVPSKLGPFGLR